MVMVFVKKTKKTQKLQLQRVGKAAGGELTSKMIEPNRNKKDFSPAKTQSVRHYHNWAKEKLLYFKISVSPMDFLFALALPTLL